MSETYICVATRLRARGPRVLPPFLKASFQVSRTARRAPGNVRTRLLGLPPLLTFFTLTVWESDEAMRDFVETPEHRAAMAHMDEWASAGEFVQFSATTARVGWRAARRNLRSNPSVLPQGPADSRPRRI